MPLSNLQISLLKQMLRNTTELTDEFYKCSLVIRQVLENEGRWSPETEEAVCNSGYEETEVAQLYDAIRDLIANNLMQGRGNFALPAGPRFTECKITNAGLLQLSSMHE